MTLIDNAGKVWHKLWSVRLALLAALFSGVEFAVTLAPDFFADFLGRGPFAALAAITGIGAAFARIVVQWKLHNAGE